MPPEPSKALTAARIVALLVMGSVMIGPSLVAVAVAAPLGRKEHTLDASADPIRADRTEVDCG